MNPNGLRIADLFQSTGFVIGLFVVCIVVGVFVGSVIHGRRRL